MDIIAIPILQMINWSLHYSRSLSYWELELKLESVTVQSMHSWLSYYTALFTLTQLQSNAFECLIRLLFRTSSFFKLPFRWYIQKSTNKDFTWNRSYKFKYLDEKQNLNESPECPQQWVRNSLELQETSRVIQAKFFILKIMKQTSFEKHLYST